MWRRCRGMASSRSYLRDMWGFVVGCNVAAHLSPRGVQERRGRVDQNNAVNSLWHLYAHSEGENAAK